MKFRYRALKSRLAWSEFRQDWTYGVRSDVRDLNDPNRSSEYEDRLGYLWLGLLYPLARPILRPLNRVFQNVLALVSVPLHGVLSAAQFAVIGQKDVEATEAEADEQEITGWLNVGVLRPSDLVQIEGVWRTFAETVEFGDVCEAVVRRERPLQLLIRGIVFVVVFAAVALLIWAVASIPSWVMASAR